MKAERYLLYGVVLAAAGMLLSDWLGDLFNGMNYGSAVVLAMCMYLCVVIVTCTGLILSRLDRLSYAERKEGSEEEKPQ